MDISAYDIAFGIGFITLLVDDARNRIKNSKLKKDYDKLVDERKGPNYELIQKLKKQRRNKSVSTVNMPIDLNQK